MAILEIRDLHVTREGKEILKGVNLKTGPGEVHAIMGPNGSGKSTLAYTLLAHPKYEVTKGDILLDGESILELSADQRAKKRTGLRISISYRSIRSWILTFSQNSLQFTKQSNARRRQRSFHHSKRIPKIS